MVLRNVVSFVILSVLGVPAISIADTGTSNNFFYFQNLDEKHYFISRSNLVTRDGIDDFFFGYIDANLGYRLNENWSGELGYRQAYLKLNSDWRTEYRPMISLVWRGNLGEWNFRNRHRLEFRYFEGDSNNRIRYRNESDFTAPVKLTRFNLVPYITEEIFYESEGGGFNENWFTVGISKKFGNNKKWKLGYRLQSTKFTGEWNHRHVLVTGISILNF